MDTFTQSYIACLLWTCVADTSDGADDTNLSGSGYSVDNIAPDSLAKIVADCQQFQHDHRRALAQAQARFDYEIDTAGHDFALTRNGHGAGFWDRGLGTVGVALSYECGHGKKWQAVCLYVGDDGLLHYGEG